MKKMEGSFWWFAAVLTHFCPLELPLALVPGDDGVRPRSGRLARDLVSPVGDERSIDPLNLRGQWFDCNRR